MHSGQNISSRVDLSLSPLFVEKRMAALAYADKLGLPTKRLEAWHYTDLRQLLKDTDIKDSKDDALIGSDTVISSPYYIDLKAEEIIVSPELLTSDAITISPLLENEAYLASIDEVDAMAAYNLALFDGGYAIDIHSALAHPLVLRYSAGQHVRQKLNIASDVSVELVEVLETEQYINLVMDTELKSGAKLQHTVLQERGSVVSLNRILLGDNAQFNKNIICATSRVARHDVQASLCGVGAHVKLNGIIVAQSKAHIDLTSTIRHQSGDTSSATLIRSIIADDARAVFQGKICVDRDAQKVEAEQNSNALLLSDRAAMNAKPELEIYADDVACAHGSTIGEIDRDALFFLRSRGIGVEEAITLLLQGFVSEVLEDIQNEALYAFVCQFIAERLNHIDVSQINSEDKQS